MTSPSLCFNKTCVLDEGIARREDPPEVGPWPFKFASGTNENALTALTSGSSRVAAPAVQDTLSDICHSSVKRKKLPAMHRV